MHLLQQFLLDQFKLLSSLRHVAWTNGRSVPDTIRELPQTPALLLDYDELTWHHHRRQRWLGNLRLVCRLVQPASTAPRSTVGFEGLGVDPLVPFSMFLGMIDGDRAFILPNPLATPVAEGRFRLGPLFPVDHRNEAAPPGLQVHCIVLEGVVERFN